MTMFRGNPRQRKGAFLIVRTDAIGDIVLSIPVFNNLKKWYPEMSVKVLVNENFSAVLENHSCVDELIFTQTFDAMTLKEKASALKKHKFDAVIFLDLNSDWLRVARMAEIPVRIGDSQNFFLSFFLTHPVPLNFHNLSHHIIEKNLLLLSPLQDPSWKVSTRLDITVSKTEKAAARESLKRQGWKREPLIVIQPCTGGSDREWLPKHFTHLIRLIHYKTDYRVVLTGAGPREESVIQEISHHCKVSPFLFTGYGTLSGLKGVIALSVCFMGTNTGPMHIAVALKKPIVALFPSKFQKPLQWGPWNVPHTILRETAKCPFICEPRICEKDDCLVTIDPGVAFDAIRSLLDNSESYPVIHDKKMIDVKVKWFRKTASILIYVSRDHDLVKAVHTYRLCQEQNLRVFFAVQNKTLSIGLSQMLRLSQRRIQILSIKTPFKWVRFCAKKDISVIHMVSTYNPFYMKCLQLLMALKMYVPPLLVIEPSPNPSSLGCLSLYFLNKFQMLEKLVND